MSKLFNLFLLLAALLFFAAPCVSFAGQDDVPRMKTVAPYPEMSQKEYLYEVVRYLYLWHLTAENYERIIKDSKLTVWLEGCEYSMDANDKSQFGRIFFPRLSMEVGVKKSDYLIKELNVDVKGKSFKVSGVELIEMPDSPPAGAVVVELDMKELLDYLWKTRGQKVHPDEALFARLRKAVVTELGPDYIKGKLGTLDEQVVFVSPLTPVSNEVWNYWVNGRLLIQFSSDIDLSDPAVWDNETLMVKVYDIDHQVVLTMDEVPGSNRFITRTRAEHLLYNCIVLGERIRLKEGQVVK